MLIVCLCLRFVVVLYPCVPGSASGGPDAGRLQGQGRWNALCLVHPADALSKAHGPGGCPPVISYVSCRYVGMFPTYVCVSLLWRRGAYTYMYAENSSSAETSILRAWGLAVLSPRVLKCPMACLYAYTIRRDRVCARHDAYALCLCTLWVDLRSPWRLSLPLNVKETLACGLNRDDWRLLCALWQARTKSMWAKRSLSEFRGGDSIPTTTATVVCISCCFRAHDPTSVSLPSFHAMHAHTCIHTHARAREHERALPYPFLFRHDVMASWLPLSKGAALRAALVGAHAEGQVAP